MIDVLAFPPDDLALDVMRSARHTRCQRLEERGRLALFISVGLFLAWAADVGATFGAASGALPLAFGITGIVLAVTIVLAHIAGRHALRRARVLRRQVDHDFAAVRVFEAGPLLTYAASNCVVAQYLRMVGRQHRALRRVELTSLSRWVELSIPMQAATPAAQSAELEPSGA